MVAEPTSRPRGGNSEDSARAWLDTTAAVAADPTGYKERLADLDKRQAASLAAETKARGEQQTALDALEALRVERQNVEAAQERLKDDTIAAQDAIRRATDKLHADSELRTRELETREAGLDTRAKALAIAERACAAKTAQLDARLVEVATQIAATAEARAKAEEATLAANRREAVAKATVESMRVTLAGIK